MDLAFRDLGGSGQAFVILHGLFGSSQNWVGMGRRLLDRGRCFLLDLRNHGDSAHSPEHSLAACVADVAEWAATHAPPGPLRLIGHSMGGLVAMGVAIRHPEITAAVASLDIAPRAYPADHGSELAALSMDISACRTRADLDRLLRPLLPDAGVRQFILTNAVRDGEGFRWRIDAAVLAASTVSRDFDTFPGSFPGRSLLVAAGKSPYVDDEGRAAMLRRFPAARIVTIPDAGHWLHVTAPEELHGILSGFLGGGGPMQ